MSTRRGMRIAALVVLLCTASGDAAVGTNHDGPVTATWAGVGMRTWATRLSSGTGVAVIVDRRIDPDAPISLECRGEPLGDVVERAAKQAGGESALLTSSIRIVPTGVADVLLRAERARNARQAKLPPGQRAILAERQAWNWPEAACPGELVADVATESRVSIDGIDALPHDHMPAATLPPLSLAERLDLLLAHYDRRIEWRPGTAGRPAGRIIAIDADLPPPQASIAENRTARGRPPAAVKPRPVPGQRDTFSLQVAAPLDQVLMAIAMRLGLRLEIDRESLRRQGVDPGEIVKTSVQDASRDQLLDAVLSPFKLDWTIGDGTLRIVAAADGR